MIVERPSQARGRSAADGLESRHAFSFGRYYDTGWMGFGALRVINESRLAPGAAAAPHRYANMEILSYGIGGALTLRDGDEETAAGPGDLQWLSAGHGIERGERVLVASYQSQSGPFLAQVFDATTGKAVSAPVEHNQLLVALALSPCGEYAATCSGERDAPVSMVTGIGVARESATGSA